ncbi:unnamed protein product [Rotaria sp. Silwood1]|nr:unnamed protein product [Rotaria sp. Silwood1]CAF1615033.1 unnamed protein product [Rotaria sp. Silwood1]CAF3733365.1 unnamed protein product [Rotaria sp. Silwood1]CAF4827873.1 unnamed protein product [Rotaria sp. Silwood1]
MVVGPIILAYFTAWSIYQRSYIVTDIPGDKITHINYAFANIGFDGRITLGDSWADIEKTFNGDRWDQPLRGNFNQLIKLKEKYSHLRTLISVGGWTWSGKFSDVALTDQSRSTFAASCLEFINNMVLMGEYPVSGGLPGNTRRPEDKQNYVLLLKEIRRHLDAVPNKKYLLTVATGAGTERIYDMDLPGMSTYLDWFNVMTYDFHDQFLGSSESKTGHNAPLYKNNNEETSDIPPSFIKSKYNCHESIQAYIRAGVSTKKILMGLPLYGRGWQGVKNTALNGFSQTASNQLPSGTWENGVYDYDHLKKSFISSNKHYWDNQSKVPFIFNSSTGLWISYDNLESITLKTIYIKQNNLAGAFFWELSSDRQAELIGATFNLLNNNIKPPVTTNPSSTSYPNNKVYPWKINIQYYIGQRVIYEKNIYRCIKQHKSTGKNKPNSKNSFWQLETSSTFKTITTTTTTTTQSSNENNISEWKPYISYLVNNKVIYQGKKYRCRQAHTSLSDWIPPALPALWLEI